MVAIIIFMVVIVIIMAFVLVFVYRDTHKANKNQEANINKDVERLARIRAERAARERADQNSQLIKTFSSEEAVEEKVRLLPRLKKTRLANLKALLANQFITEKEYKLLFKKFSQKSYVCEACSTEQEEPYDNLTLKRLNGVKRLIEEENIYEDETRKWGDAPWSKRTHIDPRKYKLKKREARRALKENKAEEA